MPGTRLDTPAFHRNHAAIGTVLEAYLHGRTGDVLELGGGSGQHAAEFARRLPAITWWPSDINDDHLRSIAAWRDQVKLKNLRAPVPLDASESDWHLREHGLPTEFLAIFCANVIHISPWTMAEGLFAGAGRHLRADGRLLLYGPFKRGGQHNAPSNAEFDASLRSRNPQWGVRDTTDLRVLAKANGLRLVEIAEMPSNNAILVFERAK
jgi:SAM-dependent methyltransferase